MRLPRFLRQIGKIVRRDSALAGTGARHGPTEEAPSPVPSVVAQTTEEILSELCVICGEPQVDAESLSQFAVDGVVPTVMVCPASAEEIAEVVRFASAKELVVVPAGGFTQQERGSTPERVDILLRTHRLNRLERDDPKNFILRAQAGCTLAALHAEVASHGQCLALDPTLPQSATLGGLLATATDGQSIYGGAGGLCCAIRFVSGDGKLLTTQDGVVENFTGHDLREFLIGSLGTLGIIVGADLRPRPLPGGGRPPRTFIRDFPELGAAIAFCNRLLALPATFLELEIVSWRAREYLREDPPLVRDPDEYAPSTPLSLETSWRVIVRGAGPDEDLERYRRELGPTQELEGAAEEALWRCMGNFEQALSAQHRNAMFIRVNVPPQGIFAALGAAEQAALDNSLLSAAIARVTTGSLLLAFIPLAVGPPSAMHYAMAVSALRSHLPEDASAIVTRCPHEAKTHFSLWGTLPAERMRRVKRLLDPKNILNRGRYIF